MKKLAIIIVNWNGKKFLKNCLNAVYKQTYKNFDVYFVDNGSIDGSSDYVKKTFPKTEIIQLNTNTGFAKGNNEGIKEAFKDKQVEYIVCLNNDTIVDKNWLKELIKTAESDKKIGAVGGKALFENGKIQTIGMRFVKDLQGDKNGGLSIGYGEKSKKYTKEREVFCPSGVSILFKRKVLEEVGLFDEDFFSYVEDFDLGWRIRKAGYISIYAPRSKLVHLHSQTGGAASPFKAYYIKRNIYLTAIKNYDFFNLLAFPFRDFAWNLKNLTRKNKLRSVNVLKSKVGIAGMIFILFRAYISIIIYTPKMLIKRLGVKKE